VTDMLQGLIDETIEEIHKGSRQDGLALPLQARRAAAQVLSRFNLTSTLILERLFREMVRMQEERKVLSEWNKLASTSLADFIAEAAKQQMGDEYSLLIDSRFEELSPSRAADFG